MLGVRLGARVGPSVFLALRGALAVAISWQIARWLFGRESATLAPISALIVLQPTGWQTVRRAGERLVGVVLGVSVAAFAAHFFGIGFAMIALVVAAAYAVGFAVQKRGAYLAQQVPISATLGLLVGGQGGAYPIERTLGAVVGGLIGTGLSLLLTPPYYVEQARRSVADAAGALASVLPRLALAFTQPQAQPERKQLYQTLRDVEDQVESAEQALALGVESTRLNLWARGASRQLESYPPIVLDLQRVARQLRRIAYTLQEDLPGRGELAAEPWAHAYADLLRRVQDVLTGMTERMRPDSVSPPGPDALKPALERLRKEAAQWERQMTQEIERAALPSAHLALKGALLLDMQRMIAELEEASEVIRAPPFAPQIGAA